MSSPLIPIDLTKSPKDQVLPMHNRTEHYPDAKKAMFPHPVLR
jgi:hypothetical protein